MTGKNVTPIGSARKNKSSGIDNDAKLKVAEVYRLIAASICRRDFSLLPPFPKHYEVLELELGARIPLLVGKDGSVTIARIEAVQNDIVAYCETELRSHPDFALGPRQVLDAAKYYMMTATPLPPEAVKITRWHSDPGLTYRRLPWDLEAGSAPTWETLLNRMSNAEAFLSWIGSLFFDKSSLHSYIWLHGVGGEGKGAINRFLAKVFGASYRSKQPPPGGKNFDKFWAYGLLGARLVVFPDCDNYTFTSQGMFKSLTGGDPIDLEAKGQMSFTGHLSSKFLVISNEKPSLSSEKADMRRIIYCELSTTDSYDPEFEEKLWREGGAFLTACVERYAAKYGDHRPIQSDSEEISGWVSTIEEPFEVIFDKWLTLSPSDHVSPREMQNVLKTEWPNSRRCQLDFMRWLEKTHQIRRARRGTNPESRYWCYPGVQFRHLRVLENELNS